MPKDTKTLGNNKARAWESLGFAHKKRLCQHFDTTSFILVSFYKILRELKLHSLCFCFNKSTLTILYLKQMKMLF